MSDDDDSSFSPDISDNEDLPPEFAAAVPRYGAATVGHLRRMGFPAVALNDAGFMAQFAPHFRGGAPRSVFEQLMGLAAADESSGDENDEWWTEHGVLREP